MSDPVLAGSSSPPASSASPPTPQDYWTVFTAYESGKSRRYGHLFAVNGGAFAIVGFLAPRYAAGDLPSFLFGLWAFIVIPILLGFFAWYMCRDIDSFGRGMRALAGFGEDPAALKGGIYRNEGRRLLRLVQAIFTSAWFVAAAIGIISALLKLPELTS